MDIKNSNSTLKSNQINYLRFNTKYTLVKPDKQIVIDRFNIENIPINALKNTESLDLLVSEDSANELPEIKIGQFMNYFKNVKRIELFLSRNNSQSSNKLFNKLLESIQLYDKLESLSIKFNPKSQIDNSIIQNLEETFKRVSYINEFTFEFYGSQTDIQKIQKTFSTFIHLTNLNKLQIKLTKYLNVTSKDFICLSSILKSFNHLTEYSIVIESNKLRNIGAQGLFSSLRSVAGLKKLQLIINKGNYIQSEGYKQLSSNLVYLKNLEVLELVIEESEKLDSQMIKLLFKSIGSLLNLISVSIQLLVTDSISLTSDCIQQLETSFKNLNKLTHFDIKIENCLFQESKIDKAFQKLFQNAKSLNNLQFNFNTAQKVKENSIISLIQSFTLLKSLKQLGFTIPQTQNLSSDFVKQLENVFKNLVGLQEFSLTIQEQSKIEGDHIKQFFDVLSLLSNLTLLKLEIRESFFLDENSRVHLFNSIQKLKHLEYLSFKSEDSNLIQQNGFKSMGQALKYIKQLKQLHLSFGYNNQIQTGLNQLANSFIHLQSLSILNLEIIQFNKVNITEFKEFLSQIGCLTNLTQLILKFPNQELEYESIQSLNNSFEKLSNLKSLILVGYIAQNQPDNTDSLFYGIKFLQNLEEINLILYLDETYYLRDQIEILCQITCLPKIQLINLSITGNHILETCRQKQLKPVLQIKFMEYDFIFSKKIGSNSPLKPEDLSIREENFKLLKRIIYFNLNIDSNNELNTQCLSELFTNFKYLINLKEFNINATLSKDVEKDLLVNLIESISQYKELNHLILKFICYSQSGSAQRGSLIKNVLRNLNCLEKIYIVIEYLNNFKIADKLEILEVIQEKENIQDALLNFSGSSYVQFKKIRAVSDQMEIENKLNQDEMQNEDFVKHLNQNYQVEFEINIKNKSQIDQEDLLKLNEFLRQTQFDKLALTFQSQSCIDQEDIYNISQSLLYQKRLTDLSFYLYKTLKNNEQFKSIIDSIARLQQLQKLEFQMQYDSYQVLYQALYFVGVAIQKQWQIQLKEFNYQISSQIFSLQKANSYPCLSFLELSTTPNPLQTFKIFRYQYIIESDQIEQLGQGLLEIPNLETINISVNYHNSENSQLDVWRYFQNLQGLENIQNINLNIKQDNNKYSDEGKSLFKALSVFKNLQQLNLTINDLSINQTEESFSELINTLQKMNNLTILNLKFLNNFKCSRNSGYMLGQCISQMVNLEELCLNNNKGMSEFQNDINIAQAIQTLNNLKRITLHLTNFQNVEDQANFLFLAKQNNSESIDKIKLKGETLKIVYYNKTFSNLWSNKYKKASYQRIEGIKNSQYLDIFIFTEFQIPHKIFEIITETKEIQIFFHQNENATLNQNSLLFLKSAVQAYEKFEKQLPQIYLDFEKKENIFKEYFPKCLELLQNCRSLKIKAYFLRSFTLKEYSSSLASIQLLSNLTTLILDSDIFTNQKIHSSFKRALKRLVIKQITYLQK